jgi:hypothetical protein
VGRALIGGAGDSGSLAMLAAMRLVAGEQLGRRAPTGLVREIDVGQRLPAGVADDEAGVGFFGGPGRREAARGWHGGVLVTMANCEGQAAVTLFTRGVLANGA